MANINNQKLHATKEQLIELHVVRNMTQEQIAKHFNVALSTIHYNLKKHGLNKARQDITGKIYNKLTVIERAGSSDRGTLWKCRCECGKYKNVTAGDLASNQIKSCGCVIYYTGNRHSSFKGFGELYGITVSNIKDSAKKRGIIYCLTPEYLWNLFLLQNRKCAITGLDLFFAKTANHQSKECNASLDRIDSSEGYIEGNVWWVHKIVNVMKSNLSTVEFIKMCELVYKNNKDICKTNTVSIDHINQLNHTRR